MKDIRKHAETMADTVTPIIRGVLTEHWQAALEEIRDHQAGEAYKNRLIKAVKAEKMDEPIENYFLDIIDRVYKLEKPPESEETEGLKEDRKDKCIHPDCECLDYCEADDPYSKTPIEKATPKNGL